MKLSELIKKLQSIEIEMGSHPTLDDSLSICTEDIEFDIVDIVPQMTSGCGCWHGAMIEIKKMDDSL